MVYVVSDIDALLEMKTFKFLPGFLPVKAIGGYKGKINYLILNTEGNRYWSMSLRPGLHGWTSSIYPAVHFWTVHLCPHINILMVRLRLPSITTHV